MTPPIVLVVGPTAGGKTALAIELAERLPGGGECICADSMQVYRGLDIGTAKPTTRERARVPHWMVDVAEPSDDGFSVDDWLRGAEQAIADIRARGRWPVVVGGTNLYVQALLYGLFNGPPADPAFRAELEGSPLDELRRRLESVDPAAAERIHRNDRRRTVRALEVHAATGTPLSQQQREWMQPAPRDDAVLVGMEWPVDAINRRINARVKAMFERGLVDEVRALHEGGRLGTQAREALGYKQVLAHLAGQRSLEDCIEDVKIRTRRYAKQQRTWLRRFRAHPRAIWIPMGTGLDVAKLTARIAAA